MTTAGSPIDEARADAIRIPEGVTKFGGVGAGSGIGASML